MDFLETNFPQFPQNSKHHQLEIINQKLEGKSNLAFFIENTLDNLIIGAYYSISFPKIFSPDKYFKDDQACIFEVTKNQIFKANTIKNQHLRTLPDNIIVFGNW